MASQRTTLIAGILLFVAGGLPYPARPAPAPSSHARLAISMPGAPSAADRQRIERAARVLVGHCAGLRKNWQRLVSRTAEIRLLIDPATGWPTDYHTQEFGWDDAVRFSLKIGDDPPPGLPHAAGEVLTYVIGTGSRPGIAVGGTKAAHRLCGLASGNGDEGFIDAPELVRPARL